MKIAVIGAGKVGSGWAKAGHTVIFGVQDINKADLKAVQEPARQH